MVSALAAAFERATVTHLFSKADLAERDRRKFNEEPIMNRVRIHADRQARAFTLVEVLVVVGVITILIAMLMPALSKAKAHARRIACSSNLRQLGMVVSSYVGEHKGKLPYNGICVPYDVTTHKHAVPNGVLDGLYNDGYIDHSETVNIHDGLENVTSYSTAQPKYLVCPASEWSDRTIGLNAPLALAGEVSHFRNSATKYAMMIDSGANEGSARFSSPDVASSYGFNAVELGGDPNRIYKSDTATVAGYVSAFANATDAPSGNPFGFVSDGGQKSMSFVAHSAEAWMAWDGPSEAGYWGLIAGGMAFRHPGLVANFLYFDGHVEGLACTEIDGQRGHMALGVPLSGLYLGAPVSDSRLLCNP